MRDTSNMSMYCFYFDKFSKSDVFLPNLSSRRSDRVQHACSLGMGCRVVGRSIFQDKEKQ